MGTSPGRILSRAERAQRAAAVARDHGGVAHRRRLRAVGLTRADIRTEVAAGRWTTHGIHTVAPGSGDLSPGARRRRAVWESGPVAVLDGVSALQAAGMTGYATHVVDVTVPQANRRRRVSGVRSGAVVSVGR